MTSNIDLILLDPHEVRIRSLLAEGAGSERAAYMLFGIADIARDPWSGASRRRFVSHAFRPIDAADRISASERHITWQTDGFMRLLGDAVSESLIPAIVHTHPDGHATFSTQDDINEAELARTVIIKGATGLLSLVVAGDERIAARLWLSPAEHAAIVRILHSGPRLSLVCEEEDDLEFLDRQARLFGERTNRILTRFRCGIAGGGATGSATLPLLMRLGVREVVLFEKDRAEDANLNRLHGARRSDVASAMLKADIHTRTVDEADLGMTLVTVHAWVGERSTWEALKACDVIFCCTDDHAGRLFLNRFARFYGIPVIDMGLAMQRRLDGPYDLFARVSALVPSHPCLLCGGYVSPRRAREETLRRKNPDAYEQLKAEAYVLGEGDPSPAVVTFTTEAACMAVNEWLAGITGFTGAEGMTPTRMRRFHARDERFPETSSRLGCPACDAAGTLGRGDVDPFLDLVT